MMLPFPSTADDGSFSRNDSQEITKNKNDNGQSGRPKAPSKQCIYFSYDMTNGNCYFTLPADVEYIDIEMTNYDNRTVYVGSVDTLSPIWHQSLTIGEYYIVCTADNGDIYSGYIFI